jgi:hypothetical protein
LPDKKTLPQTLTSVNDAGKIQIAWIFTRVRDKDMHYGKRLRQYRKPDENAPPRVPLRVPADALGLNVSTLSRKERGERPDLTRAEFSAAIAACDAYMEKQEAALDPAEALT